MPDMSEFFISRVERDLMKPDTNICEILGFTNVGEEKYQPHPSVAEDME